MRDYSRTELTEAIDEWILNEKHRSILKSRMIDGLTFDELSEKYYMSPRQIKRIVYKSQEILFRHI
jgi:DNA-directed RNA polymerase specialized sigma subunit